MRIAVTRSSGLVGRALVPYLITGGHDVVRLVRSLPRERGEVGWDPAREKLDASALSGVEGVVHLAGENIADGRWTAAKKARLRESRVGPTRLLAQGLAGMKRPPKVLVCAPPSATTATAAAKSSTSLARRGRASFPGASWLWVIASGFPAWPRPSAISSAGRRPPAAGPASEPAASLARKGM
jgi:NAD dependent epimerase/dehydratase family enzyme